MSSTTNLSEPSLETKNRKGNGKSAEEDENEDDEVVMQLHPAKKDYINNHPCCLHLWKPEKEEIPLPPLFMIGTMGAFIKLRSSIPNRNALVDMGASGPLAGFVVAAVVSMVGLARSEVIRMPEAMEGGALLLGNSLLFSFLSNAVIGHLPEGYDVLLNSVAFSGWFGLFVTAINLLPFGQLDGGHVIYALFGPRHRLIGKMTVVALLPLGIFWRGWFVWAFLLLMVLGMKHPPPYDIYQPLDRRRRLIGYVAIGVFLLSFTPVPFRFG